MKYLLIALTCLNLYANEKLCIEVTKDLNILGNGEVYSFKGRFYQGATEFHLNNKYFNNDLCVLKSNSGMSFLSGESYEFRKIHKSPFTYFTYELINQNDDLTITCKYIGPNPGPISTSEAYLIKKSLGRKSTIVKDCD